MNKFKRLMALAAVSMLGVQLMGAGLASAANVSDSDCDFGRNDLEITLGQNGTGGDKADVDLYIDADGLLVCDTPGNGDEQAVSTIDSITVVMDDEESDGELHVLLGDDTESSSYVEWPDFDTFDIDVTTTLHFDGSAVGTGSRNALRVVAGAKTVSFNGTTANYAASALNLKGGGGPNLLDASKATVKVTADGGSGKNVIKGGSKADSLTGGSDDDVIYGYAGNDDIDCAGDGDDGDAGWGGAGLDDISNCETAAPGADDDVVTGASYIYYGDLTSGIKWLQTAGGVVSTGGAAGDDDINDSIDEIYGSSAADVVVDFYAESVYGLGGDDALKVGVAGTDNDGTGAFGGAGDDFIIALDDASEQDNALFGGNGDDVLKGKDGDDSLRGGPGRDQAWGGASNDDYCVAEVTNRCEKGRL